MGVHNLHQLLQPAAKQVQLESLSKQRLAVDASIWLYQAIKTQNEHLDQQHIRVFFSRILKLLYYQIKPVFVFDGPIVPDVKRATLKRRRDAEREGADKRDQLTGQLLEVRMKQDILRKLETSNEQTESQPVEAQDKRQGQVVDSEYEEDSDEELEEIKQKSLREKVVLAMERHQPDILTLEELKSINIDSAGFAQLPVEVQIGLLQEIRQRTKLKHWDQVNMNAEETREFSRNQIKSVVQKSIWSRKLDYLQNRGGIQNTAEGSTVIRRRVAAESNTEYILVKNDSKASWTLKQVEEATEQPLSYGKTVRTVDDSKLKDYMQFEDEQNLDDRKTMLMNNLTEDDKKVTLYGEWMIKLPDNMDDSVLHDAIYTWSDDRLLSEYHQVSKESDQESKFMQEFFRAVLAFRKVPVKAVPQVKSLFQVVSDDEDEELPEMHSKPAASVKKVVSSDSSESEGFDIVSVNISPVNKTPVQKQQQQLSSQLSQPTPSKPEANKISSVAVTPQQPSWEGSHGTPLQATPHQTTPYQSPSPQVSSASSTRAGLIVPSVNMNTQNPIGSGVYDAEIDRLRRERNLAIQGSSATSAELVQDVQELLRHFGIPYIVAPSEAEAQCAELLKLGLIDGIISDDSDVLVCGGKLVYRNMFTKSKYIERYTLEGIQQQLHLDQKRLVILAYLLGCDYTDGVTGCGPVLAMEILAEIVPKDCQFQVLSALRDLQLNCLQGDGKFWKKLKRLVFPSNFPDPRVYEAYISPVVDDSNQRFEWAQPDESRIRQFMYGKLHWGQQKVDGQLQPVLKKMAAPQTNQTTLDAFIVSSPSSKGSQNSAKKKPSRMSKALKKMANEEDGEVDVPEKKPRQRKKQKLDHIPQA